MNPKPKEGYIAYNTRLTKLTKENRNNPTKPEERMWYEILCRKKTGFKFLRQKPILNFILDFYCSELLLGIEVDGDSHAENKEYDDKRTGLLREKSIKIIRYTNDDVMNNIVGVGEDLLEKLEERVSELQQNK